MIRRSAANKNSSSHSSPRTNNVDIGSFAHLHAKNIRAAEADLDDLATLVGRISLKPQDAGQQQHPKTAAAPPTVSVVCLQPQAPKNSRPAETELDDLSAMVGRISLGKKTTTAATSRKKPRARAPLLGNNEDDTAVLGRYYDTVISQKTNQPVDIRRCSRLLR